MKKAIVLILGSLILVGVIAYFVLQHYMSKPFYEPGMVRNSQDLDPPEQNAKSKFFQMSNEIKIHYFTQGKGNNLLFVHGGPGLPAMEPYPGFDRLADKYRITYFDQRGSGRSTRPFNRFQSSSYYENMKQLEQKLGLSAQIADIERIRRIQGEERLIIVGHSFGAFIATLYAAEFPERVKAMVLIAPADVLVFPQTRAGLFEEIKNTLPDSLKEEYRVYLESYFDFESLFEKDEAYLVEMNAGFAKYYLASAQARGYDLPNIKQARMGGWMVQAIYFSMGQKHDYREALSSITAPVLVIHGNQDMQSADVAKEYTELISNSEFKEIEGAGHFPFYEQPYEFAEVVRVFLRKYDK